MVGRLLKILSWNVTKLGLFFNIVPFEVHTLLPPVLQYLDPISKKKKKANKKEKKTKLINRLSSKELFTLQNFLPTFIHTIFDYKTKW